VSKGRELSFEKDVTTYFIVPNNAGISNSKELIFS
jgi:hypothetical protein